MAGAFSVGAAVVLVSTFSQQSSDDDSTRTAAVAEHAGGEIVTAGVPQAAEGGPVEMGAARSISIPEPEPAPASNPEPAQEMTAKPAPAQADGDEAVPDSSDPRWANAFAGQSTAQGTSKKLPKAALAMVAERHETGAVKALSSILANEPDPELPVSVDAAPMPAPDSVRTASLSPRAPAPQAAATEERTEAEEETPAAPAQTSGAAPTSTRTVRKAVNMRTGPGNSHRVIGVVPQGVSVGVVSCDSWCEIVHNDRRGFVFADFLRQPQKQAEAAPQQATPNKAEATRTKKVVEDPFNVPTRSP